MRTLRFVSSGVCRTGSSPACGEEVGATEIDISTVRQFRRVVRRGEQIEQQARCVGVTVRAVTVGTVMRGRCRLRAHAKAQARPRFAFGVSG